MTRSNRTTRYLGVAFLGTALGVMSMAPAMAGGLAAPVAEPPVAAPAPVAVSPDGNWTGAYVGGSLSYGRSTFGAPDGHGALYGLRGGYDYDFGKFVVGGTLAWDKSNIDLSGGTGSLDDVGRLGLRAGADLGKTLVYATAGVARGSATLGGVSQHDTGAFGGIGAEYKISSNVSVGGEILENRFGNFNGSGTDLKATTAGVNVNFRF